MTMLDETISPGQTGHIADHEQIAEVINDLAAAARNTYKVYDVTEHGVVGDGVTDDTAAIQAVFNFINSSTAWGSTNAATPPPTHAVVYFPPGTYIVTSLLTIVSGFGFSIYGAGPSQSHQTGRSKILFTGSTGGLLKMSACSDIEIAGIEFWYDNASFTGDLVMLEGTGAGDFIAFHVHHCSTKYGHVSTGNGNAQSTFRLTKAIIGSIDHCHFTGGQRNLYLGDGYVNVVQIEKCSFNFSAAGKGLIYMGTADGESITIRDCTFEARTAIEGKVGNALYNFVFENNWMGDAGDPVVWINGLHNVSVYACSIRNNRFASCLTGGTHLKLSGNLWIVEGNSFEGGTPYDSTDLGSMRLITIANLYASPTGAGAGQIFSAAEPPGANYISIGNTVAGTTVEGAQNRMGGRLGFGVQDLTVATSSSEEQLVIGGHSLGGYADLPGQQGALYMSGHNVIIQADGTATDREVRIVAGTAGLKEAVFRASYRALGFYNTAPVTKQTITGSRGGNAAVASIASKLAQIGLFTDGTTA